MSEVETSSSRLRRGAKVVKISKIQNVKKNLTKFNFLTKQGADFQNSKCPKKFTHTEFFTKVLSKHTFPLN